MLKIKQLLLFSLLFLVFNGLLFYIGWNGWVFLSTAFGFQTVWLYSTLVALLSYAFIIGRASKRLSVFTSLSYLWFGVIQYGLILLPLANIVFFLLTLASIPKETAILSVGSVTGLLFIGIYLFGLFNAYMPIVRKHEITVPKKKGNLNKLRIAVASDMHFGRLSGRSHLRRLVSMMNDLKPDLILLPGDIIDDEPEPFIEKNMGALMDELEAPLGIFGVLGNHEYYGGKIPQFVEEMKNIDIDIMMDDILKIEDSFYLVGRKDRTDKNRKPFSDLIDSLDLSYPIIAMDHQPYELKQAQESGVDILLSGHTHRGQMAPNHFITKKMYELDWGYLKKEQLHAFVSSGFGFWGPPIRIGSRSEILQIDVNFIAD